MNFHLVHARQVTDKLVYTVRGYFLGEGDSTPTDDSPVYICTAFDLRTEGLVVEYPKVVDGHETAGAVFVSCVRALCAAE